MRCGSLRPALLCLQKPPDVSERHMPPGKLNYPWNKDPCLTRRLWRKLKVFSSRGGIDKIARESRAPEGERRS